MDRRVVVWAVALFASVALLKPAFAVPVLGGELFYSGGSVTVTSLPVTSGFTSELGLYDGTFVRLLHIMDDEPSGVVVTFDPGADFGILVGSELIFGIRVISDSDREYFMGPATRNPDGLVHAAVDAMGGGVFDVGFEDLFGGGDLDFDDNAFRFTGGIVNVQTPEPGTLLLGMVALGLAGITRRRRAR